MARIGRYGCGLQLAAEIMQFSTSRLFSFGLRENVMELMAKLPLLNEIKIKWFLTKTRVLLINQNETSDWKTVYNELNRGCFTKH